MLFPTLQEVRTLSEQYSTIPVFWEIPADHWSPLQIYAALAQGEEYAFLLESVNTPERWQTWSYIGAGSELGLHVPEDGACAYHFITPMGETQIYTIAAEHAAFNMLRDMESPKYERMPEFTGGFVSAPCGKECTRIYRFYQELVAYNHLKSTAVIILNLHKGADLAAQYQAAEIRAAEIAAKIERCRLSPQYRDDEPPVEAWMEESVMHVRNAPDSFELYRRIRYGYPAPNLFYVKHGDEQFTGMARGEVQIPRTWEFSGVGFGSGSGITKLCTPEIAVRYLEDHAEITAGTPVDMEKVLELMRSAKRENHDA